jgi:hypothetical protein
MTRMRSRDEMEATLERILDCWVDVPSLRLGQLILNAVMRSKPARLGDRKKGLKPNDTRCVFHVEDDALVDAVEEMVAPVQSQQRGLL